MCVVSVRELRTRVPSYSFAIERGTTDGDNIAEMRRGGVPRHSLGLVVYVHCVIDMIATAAQHILYSIEGCIRLVLFLCVYFFSDSGWGFLFPASESISIEANESQNVATENELA